jgi:hypothetical protein
MSQLLDTSLIKKPKDRKAQQKMKIIDERKNLGLPKALVEAAKAVQLKSVEDYKKKLAEELAYKKANGYIKEEPKK